MARKNDIWKAGASGTNKNVVRRFRWWYILILLLVIIGAAAGGIYANISSRLNGSKKKVANWSELASVVSSIPSSSSALTVSSASDGKATLNDSDFDNIASKNYPIITVSRKDPNVRNILLIGIDGGDPGEDIGHRSDSMIMLSINSKTNTVKLTSIMRDIKAYFPDEQAWGKLNAAYAYGGAGQTINIINYNFKLDIQEYVLVDFSEFKSIIDDAGGITLKISDEEATQIDGLDSGGTYKLTGAQALEYARTRKTDDEFVRTQRQRTVITTLFSQLKSVGIVEKTTVANDMIDSIKTNISTADLVWLMVNYSSKINADIEQLGVPTEDNGMYTVESSPVWYFNLDWDAERKAISDFIYKY